MRRGEESTSDSAPNQELLLDSAPFPFFSAPRFPRGDSELKGMLWEANTVELEKGRNRPYRRRAQGLATARVEQYRSSVHASSVR